MSPKDTMEILHEVFVGQSAAWSTVSTLIPDSISNEFTGKPRKRRTLGKNQPLAQEAPATFPFATRAAEIVWEIAQRLVPLYPTEMPDEILRMALEKSRITGNDLSPEDVQMLMLAVYYGQNGPATSNVRTGGTPGGPSNASAGRTI